MYLVQESCAGKRRAEPATALGVGRRVGGVAPKAHVPGPLLLPQCRRLPTSLYARPIPESVPPGGDLYKRLVRAGGVLGEAEVARDVVVPLLLTLTFLHASHIVHRCAGRPLCCAKGGNVLRRDTHPTGGFPAPVSAALQPHACSPAVPVRTKQGYQAGEHFLHRRRRAAPGRLWPQHRRPEGAAHVPRRHARLHVSPASGGGPAAWLSTSRRCAGRRWGGAVSEQPRSPLPHRTEGPCCARAPPTGRPRWWACPPPTTSSGAA